MTVAIFDEWFGIPARFLDSTLKCIKYYSDQEDDVAEAILPHVLEEICKPIGQKHSKNKESFAQNSDYSLAAIILNKINKCNLKKVKVLNMYLRLEDTCQGRFLSLMKGVKCLLEIHSTYILDIDFEEVKDDLLEQVKWAENELQECLIENVWLLTDLFVAEGVQPFEKEQLEKFKSRD